MDEIAKVEDTELKKKGAGELNCRDPTAEEQEFTKEMGMK